MSIKDMGTMVLMVCFLFSTTGAFSFAEEQEEEETFSSEANLKLPEGQEDFVQVVETSSNKISLDLKGVDIIDVLKILSKRSNLNIVAGPNVRGKVTLFLKEVDVRDALEIVLAANELAYERRGDIINVMTDRDYELLYGERYHDKKTLKMLQLKYAKAVDIGQVLNQVKTKLGRIVIDEGSNTIILVDVPERIEQMEQMIAGIDMPTETKVFSLNYAKAEEVKPKLEELLTKGVGIAKADERMNKIVVTDLPKKIKEIGGIIAAFDAKTPQVLIEAKIVQVILSDDYSLGVDWDAVFRGIDATTSGSFDIISAGSYGGSFTIGTLPDNGYAATIEALQTIGKTNTLSAPRIAVVNNEEAKILVGTKEAYVTTTTTTSEGTSTTAESVTFIDVGVTLAVTPQINPDGFITMKIKPEVSSVSTTIDTAQGNVIPIVKTSEAETKVMVKDGRTIVIGGLIEDKKIDTVNKVPLLSSIPLLGVLFRSKKIEVDKTELAIFLTPHIISGDIDHPKVVVPPPGESLSSAQPMSLIEREAYNAYYGTVRGKILHLAKNTYPKGYERGEIRLSFVVSPDGSLKEEPIVLKGDDELLKEVAIQSVKDASPFPPFPMELGRSEKMFKVSITYE